MAQKATQIDFLLSGMTDAAGNALALGKVYCYAAGTDDTNKTIWLDMDKATPADNPIILDSKGTKLRYGDGLYKFVIKDSANVTIDTRDNISIGLTQGPWIDVAEYASLTAAVTAIGTVTDTTLLINSSTAVTANTTVTANIRLQFTAKGLITKTSGTLLIARVPEGMGLEQRFVGFDIDDVTLSVGAVQEVHPEWWGENTTPGTTDMSTEVQSAINSIPIAATQGEMGGGGIVKYNTGIYLLNTGLTNNGRKVSFLGSGIDNTTLRKGAGIDLIKMDSYFNFQSIRDMTLDGNSQTGTLIYLNTPNYWSLENLSLKNNGGTTADTNAALYCEQSTVGHMKHIMFFNNIRDGYFNTVNALKIYDIHLSTDESGAVYDGMEFVSITDIEIYGITMSGKSGGLAFKSCYNVKINGAYLEHTHAFNVITVGVLGQPTRGFSLSGVNISRSGTDASVSPTILVQSSSSGISISDVVIYLSQSVGAHTVGWIELVEATNVSIKNVIIRGFNAVLTAANVIKTSSVGPDYVTLENIYAQDNVGNTESMTLRADYLIVRNTNIPIEINGNSTNVLFENASGVITGNAEISIASATALAVGESPVYSVSGTTSITSITAESTRVGKRVTLIFADILTFTKGNNLKLVGNFVTSVDDTITLVSDGINWIEVSRSIN